MEQRAIDPRKTMGSPNVRLRIDFDSSRALGPGKVGLLEAVARTGSLTAAAAECGMSYKRAWVLLRSVNELFGAPLATMAKGGRGGGGGARVTAIGREVIAAYRLVERKADAAVSRAFARFPVPATRRAARPAVKRLNTLSADRRSRRARR
jgi:molybdate transport system regulatory protein